MTTAEFDAIQEALINKMSIKKDIALAAAQKEIDAIQREYDAYFDGVDDALKAVRAAMKERQGDRICDNSVIYETGDAAEIDNFDFSNAECAAGFHFFNTREEAKNDKY